jgi:tetratricopeptide (TPR) repeat protein
MEARVRKMLALARELAAQHSDKSLERAADILLHLVSEGVKDPGILVKAAEYLLQGPHSQDTETRAQAVSLIDQAVNSVPDNIVILEAAVHCYELTLNTYPDKLNNIICLCLKILDLDPDNVEAMITLAFHREHPGVALELGDAIRMLEWAKEVAPNNILVDFTLGRLYAESGQYNLAKRSFRKATSKTDPRSTEAADSQHYLKSLRSKSRKYRKYGMN